MTFDAAVGGHQRALLHDRVAIVTGGAMKGQRGFFSRDTSGAVVGVDLAGRLFTRLGT